MSWQKEFVELNKSIHDRESFDCGEDELNTFLHTQASRHMAAGLSKTILLPALSPLPNGKFPICAFYTIAPSSISRQDLPVNLAKKLPHYPVPVFLLAQMAVHREHKGQGLGKTTLIKALKYFHEINKYMPAYAVIVDCLNGEAESFYLQYDFKKLDTQNGKTRMFLPMKIIVQIFCVT